MADTFRKSLYGFILMLILMAAIVTSCGSGKNGSKGGGTNSQTSKQSPPKSLISLENTTEMMISDLQKIRDKKLGIVEEMKAQTSEKTASEQSQEDGQAKNKEQGKDKKEGDKKGDEGKKDAKGQQDVGAKKNKTGSETIDWAKMQKNVEKLQDTWSNYGAIAAKDGATNVLLKDFEKQLDTLTTKVMEKQEDNLSGVANDLYGYFPKFYDLYKHQAPPNIKDMKYQIRKITMEAEKDEWTNSDKYLKSLNESWEVTRSRIEKPNRDLNRKIQRAIDGFSRSVKEQNKYLTKLKGEILIKSLEEIK